MDRKKANQAANLIALINKCKDVIYGIPDKEHMYLYKFKLVRDNGMKSYILDSEALEVLREHYNNKLAEYEKKLEEL